MVPDYEEQYEQALEEYRRQRESLVEVQARLRTISCAATAPRRSVTVTVGPHGELTDLRFPTNGYKKMPPAELASVILATFAEARSKALDEVANLMAPLLPPGVPARDLVAGDVDLVEPMPENPPDAPDLMEYLRSTRPS